MLIDARTIPSGSVLSTDVVIVGAGAAGITLARALAAQRIDIALLESGGLDFDAQSQDLARGDSIGAPYVALEAARLRFFGGTTNHWYGACWPLLPIDFEVRPGIPHSGWPITRETLDPFYERAHRICQLGPFDYSLQRWRTADAPLPFVDPRVVNRVYQSSPPTRFGQVYRDDVARASTLKTYLNAHVLNITANANASTARSVKVATLSGGRFEIQGRRFIVATGAIENARLLLLSNDAIAPGLGNQHDVVGRYFMDHLMMPALEVVLANEYLPMRFYKKNDFAGLKVRGVVGLHEQTTRDEQILNFSANLHPQFFDGRFATSAEDEHPSVAALVEIARSLRKGELPSDLSESLRTVISDAGGIVGRSLQSIKNRGRKGIEHVTLEAHSEQAPNADSRVTLHATRRDRFGQPGVVLDWQLTELDKRSIRRAAEIIAEGFGRSGLGRGRVLLREDDAQWRRFQPGEEWTGPHTAFHHIGTTRMHRDARFGVVDANCKVHGTSNLYVAGSSVFPTGGFVNPTLTIVALALRLADHLTATPLDS